jgi:hypothetical protein
MPTIGDALSLLEAELFVGRERELARFRQWLGAPTPRPEILNVDHRRVRVGRHRLTWALSGPDRPGHEGGLPPSTPFFLGE